MDIEALANAVLHRQQAQLLLEALLGKEHKVEVEKINLN